MTTVNVLMAAGGPWDNICFHAQQAAEKLLKAFLIAHGVAPKKTHDLTALLTECVAFNPSLKSLEDDCDLLAAGIVARYPLEDEPQKDDAEEMRDAAQRIRKGILALLS